MYFETGKYSTQPVFTCSKFKFNNGNSRCNKGTRMASLTSFRCLYYWFWTNFTHCSGVSNVDIGQVNSSWIWAYFYQCFPVFFVTSALFRSRLARIEIKRKVVRNRFKKFFFLVNITVWSVRIRSFSDPHFPAFGLNTVIYIVKLRIRALFSQCVSQFDPMSNKS